MELVPIHKRVIGLDIHQAQITACAILENADGETRIEQRQFGAFKKDRRALAAWAVALDPDEVVLWKVRASTGRARMRRWRPWAFGRPWSMPATSSRSQGARPMSATPNGWPPWHVPGCCGSFVPPAKLRELRVISRQRQKLVSLLSAEKNRMHKVLTDAGIRLSVVVSDLHGQSARAMIKGILDGQAPHEVLHLASRRLKASREELHDALQGELTASHRFVLDELLRHIEELEARIARFDARLLSELASEKNALALLQTLPGVDVIGAAMRLVEIGSDMSVFGPPDRLASWVGICPGNHESAGKRKSGHLHKGNPYVRRLLCEFAQAARRTKSAFQSKFQSLIVRRGYKRAIVALAHKMLRTIFFMLKRGEYYRDSATHYE